MQEYSNQNRRVTIEHSLWLMPAEPLKTLLQSIIDRLAFANGAVGFDPHVTVFCGRSDDKTTIATAQHIANMFSPIELVAVKIDFTSVYTKSLFVQFDESETSRCIHAAAKTRSAHGSSYEFNPHLSLLYKTISLETLSEIRQSLAVPLGPYAFDRLRAIETEIPLTEPEQIKKWRTVFDAALH